MTQRGFELGENWQQGANDQQAEVHNALLTDSGMARVELVAQKGDKAKGATAGAEAQGPMTESEKQFQAAVKELANSPDKEKALLALGPKFDGAIKTADDDFAKFMKDAKGQVEKLAPAYEAATAKVEEKQAALMQKFAQVPKAEQEKVSSLVDAYSQLGPGDAGVKTAIEQNLAKYPGLIQGVKDLTAAGKDPAMTQMNALEAKAKQVLEDRVMTRAGYAEILSQFGQDAKAEDLIREAAKIMGIPVPEKQKPKGLLEA